AAPLQPAGGTADRTRPIAAGRGNCADARVAGHAGAQPAGGRHRRFRLSVAHGAAGYAAGMQVKELGHLVLYVRDIDRSAAFYGDALGWKRIEMPDGGPLRRMPVAASTSGRTHHQLLLIEVGEDAPPPPSARP